MLNHVNTILSLGTRADYSLTWLIGNMEGVSCSSTIKHKNECLAQLYMCYPMLPENNWVHYCLRINKCTLVDDINLQTAPFSRV